MGTITEEAMLAMADRLEWRQSPFDFKVAANMLRTLAAERAQQAGVVTDEVVETACSVYFGVINWPHDVEEADMVRISMRDTLEAIAPMLRGVPDGWKLVPIEPTVGMLDAGYVAYSEAECRRGRAWYRAVLAASPSQEKDNG